MNWDAEKDMARDVEQNSELYEAMAASPNDETDVCTNCDEEIKGEPTVDVATDESFCDIACALAYETDYTREKFEWDGNVNDFTEQELTEIDDNE